MTQGCKFKETKFGVRVDQEDRVPVNIGRWTGSIGSQSVLLHFIWEPLYLRKAVNSLIFFRTVSILSWKPSVNTE